MEIKRIEHDFTICKIADLTNLPLDSQFVFLGRTDEELSLVCITDRVPENVVDREDGWKAFRIQGVLDFSLIGVLSKISTILAENGIGIFVVSTYNTDYVLTKAEDYTKALEVLEEAGYQII